jgi:hypothetical protein
MRTKQKRKEKLKLTVREQQLKDDIINAVTKVLQHRLDKYKDEQHQIELKKRLDDFYR